MTPDGKLKWSFLTGGPIVSSPAINSAGDVYFASTDGNLYALKADGSEIWHFHTGGVTRSSPVFDAKGNVYLGANWFGFAISKDGKKLWQQDVSNFTEGAPAVTDSLIYFTSRGAWVTAITTNGDIAWREIISGAGGGMTGSPIVGQDGRIYTIYAGVLAALYPTNSAPPLPVKSIWPMFRANYEHTGRVTVH